MEEFLDKINSTTVNNITLQTQATTIYQHNIPSHERGSPRNIYQKLGLSNEVDIINYTDCLARVKICKYPISNISKLDVKIGSYLQFGMEKNILGDFKETEIKLMSLEQGHTREYKNSHKDKVYILDKNFYVSVWLLINGEWKLVIDNKVYNKRNNINIIGKHKGIGKYFRF